MKVKLKVCGMQSPDNILEVWKLSPDYMGFIFYNQSPRYLSDDVSIPAELSSSIKRVGVFVNASFKEIKAKIRHCSLDLVQLHGIEDPDFCLALHDEGVMVVKTFLMHPEFEFKALKRFKPAVDYFLFDTRGKNPGGNGVLFNWSILKRYDQEIPFFISGGISPDNVKNIHELRGMNLHAIDINSGVESTPGVKDVEKIQDLMKQLSCVTV